MNSPRPTAQVLRHQRQGDREDPQGLARTIEGHGEGRRPRARSRLVPGASLPRPGPAPDRLDRPEGPAKRGSRRLRQFDATHRLFTFALPPEHELSRCAPRCRARHQDQAHVLAKGGPSRQPPWSPAEVHMEGKDVTAHRLRPRQAQTGNKVPGPAIVMEMDSTTVILPGTRTVDGFATSIYPTATRRHARRQEAGSKKAAVSISPNTHRKSHAATIVSRNKKSFRRSGRYRHDRHHRERAAQRALRDGHRVFPHGNVAGHPRAHDEFPRSPTSKARWSSASSAPSSGASCRATTARSRKATSS